MIDARATLAIACAIACRGSRDDATAPRDGAPPTPRPIAATRDANEARDAGSADVAAAAPCASDASPFSFGRFQIPQGWCWRRTAEGDDLSGVLVDAGGRVRVRYFALAHGERVGDACAPDRPGLKWARDDRVRGIAFRYCEIDDPAPRTCFAFHGAANLCTDPSVADGFSALDLIRTLAPR